MAGRVVAFLAALLLGLWAVAQASMLANRSGQLADPNRHDVLMLMAAIVASAVLLWVSCRRPKGGRR